MRIMDEPESITFSAFKRTQVEHLDFIFSKLDITSRTLFIDIGMGEGTIIKHLLSKNIDCFIIGIEIDEGLFVKAEESISEIVNENQSSKIQLIHQVD